LFYVGIDQLERIILKSSKKALEEEESDRGSVTKARRNSITARLKKAKSFTMPRSFFNAAESMEDFEDAVVAKSDEANRTSEQSIEFKRQFSKGGPQASAEFAEMQRQIQDLKQQLEATNKKLVKFVAENKKLTVKIEKRDAALREWETFYQTEANKEEAKARDEAVEDEFLMPVANRHRSNTDLLQSTDADFNSPLIDY
jgi:hypothetical protein